MPINPQFAHCYKDGWKERRDEILERDRNRCKHCGAQKGRKIQRRIVRRKGVRTQMWWRYTTTAGKTVGGWRDEKGKRDMPPNAFTTEFVVDVQLGVAHLDGDPTNNADSNLAALCRRCHIVHDTKQHTQNAAITRGDRKDRERPLLRMIGGL